MNIKKLKLLSILVVVFGFLCSTVFGAGIPDKNNRQKDMSLMKPTGTPLYQILNINNITTWMRADGQQNHSPTTDNGSYFPRGTKWAIYQDGFVWGGKAYLDAALTQPAPTQVIRVGGQTYNIGTRAGRIIGTGASAVAQSPADADVRIYRVRRDYAEMDIQDTRQDASESFEVPIANVTKSQTDQIFDQYAKDWDEWPVAYGAPYIERNGIAGYQKPKPFNYNKDVGTIFNTDSLIFGNYDEPGLAGSDPNSPADQVIWTVINDLDRTATTGLFGSEPLGLEAQITLWGYKRTDAMGNLYFKKIKFINKGGVDIGGGSKGSFYIDSMYFAQWSDPDLGSYGDDLCGVDELLSLGFVYNGNAIDAEYKKFNLPPPAVGYDFLQGPIVPSPGDSGVFNLKRVYDKKNLPMTSFAYFSAGSPISDPPFSYEGGLRWWRMLQGYAPDPSTAPWRLYPHPTGVTETKFPLNGDPVARTGFIDGAGTAASFAPGDRRIVMNTGPFTLSPGDTQEVVMGTVAGLGGDRFSSINVMKFYDRFVQNTYNALFQVPKAPTTPSIKIAELDGEVLLEWGSDEETLIKTETLINQPGNYIFEGYNVYQFPSSSSSLADAKRIATYDLINDIPVILDEQFDTRSGEILMLPVQFGSNSGIIRHFKFNRDHVLDINKLNNGQEYYLAVTAYSKSNIPGYLPASLESKPLVYTVKSQSNKPGERLSMKVGDLVTIRHIAGVSDATIKAIVIDPKQLKNSTYKLSVQGTTKNKTYSISDSTTGNIFFSGVQNLGKIFGGTESDYPIVGGLLVTVADVPFGLNDVKTTWSGGTQWLDGYRFEGDDYAVFNGGVLPGIYGDNYFGQYAPIFDPEDSYPIEIRFSTTTTQKAYRLRRSGTNTEYVLQSTNPFVDVPFTVWDMSNPASPRQLTVSWRDQVNNSVWDPLVGADGLEVLFIYNKTYDPNGGQFTFDPNNATKGANADIVYFCSFQVKSGFTLNQNEGKLSVGINARLDGADVFTFTSTAMTKGNMELAKADVEKVGVYPNPYYAFNPAETNRFVRFVTFNKLPAKATIRIFNLAGQLVRTLTKEDPSQFLRWDLNNESNFPVASGIYVAHVDMPDVGVTKILKVAIIQEQEVPDVF
ncbi:MAG: T9SS type A sorting domain-containing protein [Bacteroidota bacterium]|nr:T9SS type A sorting domain-containing protein [Bacteroidota bacterium]